MTHQRSHTATIPDMTTISNSVAVSTVEHTISGENSHIARNDLGNPAEPAGSVVAEPISSSVSSSLDETLVSTTPESINSSSADGAEEIAANNGEKISEESKFKCNICLQIATNSVVCICGHLYCWSCLYSWLETSPTREICPVCNAAIDGGKIIPLYGRNSTSRDHCRNEVPPRPPAQRIEPPPPDDLPIGVRFNVAFVINMAARRDALIEYEQIMAQYFLLFAFLCLTWILLPWLGSNQ